MNIDSKTVSTVSPRHFTVHIFFMCFVNGNNIACHRTSYNLTGSIVEVKSHCCTVLEKQWNEYIMKVVEEQLYGMLYSVQCVVYIIHNTRTLNEFLGCVVEKKRQAHKYESLNDTCHTTKGIRDRPGNDVTNGYLTTACPLPVLLLTVLTLTHVFHFSPLFLHKCFSLSVPHS